MLFASLALSPAWKSALSGSALALVLCAVALWPTALELPAAWLRSGAYGHAWLVLPLFVYLLGWQHRDELLVASPQFEPAGVALAGFAAIAWCAAMAANIAIGRQLALILMVQAIALATLGRALFRRVLPVMALLFFLLPSADLLVQPLRLLTLKAIEWLALIGGLRFVSDGFYVHVGGFAYLVLDACAGLSHLGLLAFLGYCYALLRDWPLGRAVALAAFSALLGVLANVTRIAAIVWIDAYRGEQMTLAGHRVIQWLALALVLAILFALLLRLRTHGPRQRPALPPAQSSSHYAWYAPLSAGLVVVAIAGPVALLLDDEPRSPASASTVGVPRAVPGWEYVSADSGGGALGPPADGISSLFLDYRRHGRRVRVTVVETLSPATKLSAALLDPHDRLKWHDSGSERVSACAGTHCASFIHSVSRRDEPPLVRHVYYRYAIAAYRTESDLGLRLASAYHRLLGTGQRARLIGFASDGDTLPLAELVDVERAIDAMLANGSG